jgi:hypothetical protein
MRELLLAHAAATLAMAGLIWFVQVVHYPLMARVDAAGFAGYERSHARRTTWVVAPLMLVEAGLALLFVVRPPANVPVAQAWIGVGLVALLWASTAALQVPLHHRLARGFDQEAHRRLVASNWIRTAAWSVRGALALLWLA